MKVNPLCFTNKNFFFVKPDGSYLPCCYSSANNTLQTFLKEKYAQLNLSNNSVDDVLNSDAWKEIIEKIKSDEPFKFCKEFCPAKLEARVNVSEEIFWDGVNSIRAF